MSSCAQALTITAESTVLPAVEDLEAPEVRLLEGKIESNQLVAVPSPSNLLKRSFATRSWSTYLGGWSEETEKV